MQFTVTAVVVSYNREALLRECLDGIAAQTRPVDRVVVIDNASTDGALEVARNHPLITGRLGDAGAAVGNITDASGFGQGTGHAHATNPVQAKVVALSTNMGGAGGFCTGIAEALAMERAAKAVPMVGNASAGSVSGAASTCHPERSAQRAVEGSPTQRSPHPRHYIWLMDDDTIPTSTALAALLDAVKLSVERNHALPVALGSRAVWVDGREHLMNKPMERTWVRKGLRHLTPEPIPEQASEAAAGASPSRESESAAELSPEAVAPYQVRSLSFVSCLLSAGAIEGLARLPKSAYFLWNDDFEFTTALLRRGIGYYVPASEVVHKTKVFGSSDADPGARFYNEVRNKLWLFRFSRSNFNAAELTEFLLKTVRRWALTWLRSKDRALIADCFRRGWHDGMRTMPPSNAELFASEPEVAEAIRAVEGDCGGTGNVD